MHVIDRTILGVAPIRTSLLGVCALLSLLFTIVEPEASQGLGLLARLCFWILHIGIALCAILLVSLLIRRAHPARWPLWLLLLTTGVLGAAIATAPYLAIEALLPSLIPPDPPDSFWDRYALKGPWHAVISEFFQVLPLVLAGWSLVNLPLLLNKPTLNTPPTPPEDPPNDETLNNERQARRDEFFAALPEILGRDLILISSDLHYLNVYTTLGKTMILGSLKYYAEAFDDDGLQVHRSHWVAKAHVERLAVTGKDACCIMSNGQRVPVSRNNRKLAKACFGTLVTKHKPRDIKLAG
ncbi:LytTR family DNA-binding domain-containing protein [Gilvimarinus agarilyticus]|uniref:LytTR family DNA-binding domain-containing protein n=1 Tax=Gilvimarinus agarilyticus TaxID=679259 RepID=UPI0005A070E9|nr:LytTR family DNA-binding domain-containing protein [Gilvimarinus agarilyticus]